MIATENAWRMGAEGEMGSWGAPLLRARQDICSELWARAGMGGVASRRAWRRRSTVTARTGPGPHPILRSIVGLRLLRLLNIASVGTPCARRLAFQA